MKMKYVFEIEGSTVEEALRWARDVAWLDVEQLRSSLVTSGKLCEIFLALTQYYDENLDDCRQLIKEGKGDPVINQKRLPLLENGQASQNITMRTMKKMR